MDAQFADFNAWNRAEVMPTTRTEPRLPPDLYAFTLTSVGVDIEPQVLIQRGMLEFLETRVANLSEFAGVVANGPLIGGTSAMGGRTVNPYGNVPTGGSSSGSAVSTSALLTPVSVGAETAGSLIAPAAWNGVVGMKPSRGAVSGEGIVPLVRNNDSAGPVARNVIDAPLLLGVIGEQHIDHLAALALDTLDGVTVGMRTPFGTEVLVALPEEAKDMTDADFRTMGVRLSRAAARTLDTAFAKIGAEALVSLDNLHSTYYATAGYPAITVPLGVREGGSNVGALRVDSTGMPTGVTPIAKPGQDAELLAYAYAFEQASNLRVTPHLR
jgi:Asp-tRNA(Asn)/Glu-tRNA(Gln) amidotransferase A subunit family amidase